jgi:signal transduction histidine kinase
VIDRYQARTFSDALHMQAAMHPATAAQPVDVAQCVAEVVRMMERLHADQALEWTLQVQDGATPLWRGECTDLEEVLGNLLDNAGKWAASAVRIGLAMEEGDAAQPPQVVLQIEDDGPGMARHQLRAAGQRGLRFDDSVQGSGLGLHIATQMVQAYGGELSLGKSALLKGLSVRVVLPGVQAAQRPRKA